MPTVRISKIKLRRGTNTQLKSMVFDQGEIVSTTDTKRLYVGTGTLSGGVVVGSKIHAPILNYTSLSTVIAEVGDIINVNNIFYQLTASNYANVTSWSNVGAKIDPVTFSYDASNKIILNTASISASYIDPDTVSNGIKIESGVLQSNYNTSNMEISAYQLGIKAGGITEREINSSVLSKGLSGGSGNKLTLNVGNHFAFDGNTLTLSSAPTTIEFPSLCSSWFGNGLNYSLGDQEITTVLVDVDNSSLKKDINGTVYINDTALVGVSEWPKITVDQYGRVTTHSSSIYGALTGNSSLSGYNSSNTLSALFNGTPSHTLSGAIPGVEVVQFAAIDINGLVVSLSSAGFITFEGNTTTRTGEAVGRFAIPIFAY